VFVQIDHAATSSSSYLNFYTAIKYGFFNTPHRNYMSSYKDIDQDAKLLLFCVCVRTVCVLFSIDHTKNYRSSYLDILL